MSMALDPLIQIVLEIGPAFVTMYLVALGHSIFERAGMLDLAIDGVFFMSTGAAVLGAVRLGSPLGGTVLASVLAMLVGAFMAYVLTKFPVSHGAVGLSMQFLGYGLGIIFGYPVRQIVGNISVLCYSDEMLELLLLTTIVLGVLVHVLLERTKIGAAIRACGENPHAASSLGIDVLKTRLVAGALGFAVIGAGASFFPLLWQTYWDVKTYTMGYGWLAFTVALAGGRHPIYLFPMSLIFGGLIDFQIAIATRLGIMPDVAKLVPFIGALLAMMAYSMTGLRRIFASPQALGKPYYKEEKTM